ncbi:MAG: hypothetical protein ACFCU6_01290 [Balneolaceae bacterium]
MKSVIKKYFPNAEEGEYYTKKSVDKLTGNGFDLKKTLLATSVCSDEIIRSATNFRDYLANESPFQLGGLAGFPFTGITGFKAFASHIPDGGAAIIQFGPHIGVSKNGNVGTMFRHGQLLESTCCGALQASLNVLEVKGKPAADKEFDYQQWTIENELIKRKERILSGDQKLIKATEVMFEVIKDRINKIIEASGVFDGKKIALIGGIIINADHGSPDWFDEKVFDIRYGN